MKPSAEDPPLGPDDFARLAKLLFLNVLVGVATCLVDLVQSAPWWAYFGVPTLAFGAAWLVDLMFISRDRHQRKRVAIAWRKDALIGCGILGWAATSIFLLIGSVIMTGAPPIHIPFALIAFTVGWACQGLYALWFRHRLLSGAHNRADPAFRCPDEQSDRATARAVMVRKAELPLC